MKRNGKQSVHIVVFLSNQKRMAYAEIMGTKWKISEVEVQYPRLILTIGGVWNGDTTGTTEQT